MVRPTTKLDLMTIADQQFSKLWEQLEKLNPDAQQADFDFSQEFLEKKKEAHWRRDRNLRDVLIHLYEWHEMLLLWVEANQKGETRPFLPAPYNWRTYGELNVVIRDKHQTTSLETAKNLLKDSHQQVLEMIETFSNDELFAKNSFPWTGTSTLGSYCVSATSSHYDWAIKKLKKAFSLKQ